MLAMEFLSVSYFLNEQQKFLSVKNLRNVHLLPTSTYLAKLYGSAVHVYTYVRK